MLNNFCYWTACKNIVPLDPFAPACCSGCCLAAAINYNMHAYSHSSGKQARNQGLGMQFIENCNTGEFELPESEASVQGAFNG